MSMSQPESDLAKLASASFDHDSDFDRFGPSNFWIRLLAFLNDLNVYFVRRSVAAGMRVKQSIPLLVYLYKELGIERPDMLAFISETAAEVENLTECNMSEIAWSHEEPPPEAALIPNMLYEETMRYYRWLGRTIRPAGVVVELGCWMGCSTVCLSAGLTENPLYRGRKLHVFDGFIWHDWMWRYTVDPDLRAKFHAGDCFIDAFWEYTRPYKELLDVKRATIGVGRNGEAVSTLEWRDGPIAALILDHSDRYDINARTWEIFAPHFVRGQTIIVFNQYGNLRAEDLRRFCRDRRHELAPLHQLAASGRAFLFEGAC